MKIKEILRKRGVEILLVISGMLFSASLSGQTEYRTKGDVNFVNPNNWEIFIGASWIDATFAPDYLDADITIRDGDIATVNSMVTLDQLLVEGGATLTVESGNTLTVNNGSGTDLLVTGTVNNYGSISVSASADIRFNATAEYNHRRNGGSIPNATWDVDSDCNITGVTNTMPTGLDQTFGNFTWNCTGQTGNLYMQSNITIAGDFNVLATTPGDYDPNGSALRMSSNASGYTITVSGD